jgi:hypothetical protein
LARDRRGKLGRPAGRERGKLGSPSRPGARTVPAASQPTREVGITSPVPGAGVGGPIFARDRTREVGIALLYRDTDRAQDVPPGTRRWDPDAGSWDQSARMVG